MKHKDACKIIEYGESSPEAALSASFGRALRLLSQISKRREQSLKVISERLWPAVRLGQIEFLYDSRGAATAFASWAFLTECVSRELSADPDRALDISEWNEGDQLWLIDVFAPYGHTRLLCRKVRARMFAGTSRIRAIRSYANGKKSRLVNRRMTVSPFSLEPMRVHGQITC